MKSAFVWLVGCVLVCFLVPYQVRYSQETVEEQERYAFVPFTIRPFGNEIGVVERAANGLKPGDRLLAVNGRPFTGRTVYAQELRATRDTLQPFTVTVRSESGEVRDVVIGFAHCTCGVASRSTIILTHILPRVFCVFIGLAFVALRHQRILAWLFLALMLCLSEITIFPDIAVLTGFPQMVDVGAWRNSFRLPATAYESFIRTSWPAWLVLFSAYFFRKHGRVDPVPTAWRIAVPMLLMATAWSVASVGWSEDFSKTALLGNALNRISQWATYLGFGCAVPLAWHLGKRWVAAMATLVLCAVIFFHWHQLGPPAYNSMRLSGSAVQVVSFVPEWMMGGQFVVEAFTCLAIAIVTLANARTLGWLEATSLFALVLVAPFLFVLAALSGVMSLGFPLVTAGFGLTGITWSILRRTRLSNHPSLCQA